MGYQVAKPFKTGNRKFSVIGETIKRSDVYGNISFDIWVARGFIVEDSAPKTTQNYQPKPVNKQSK